MPSKTSFAFIEHFKQMRQQIRELVALVVALSVAINLISSAIYDTWGAVFSVTAGLIVIGACSAYVVRSRSRERKFNAAITAAFVIEGEEQSQVRATPGYTFGSEFARIALAVFEENPALRDQWIKGPFVNYTNLEGGKVLAQPGLGVRLATEIAEYLVLAKLSIHLTDYFNKSGFDGDRIAHIGRADLPHVLLSNRVLELISKDRQDRPGFQWENDDEMSESRDGWRVVSQFAGNKYYSHFELTLPRGTSVSREENGSLVFDSPAIRLSISVSFPGYRASMPYTYHDYVMGIEFPDAHDYKIHLSISGEVKNPLFGSRGRWLYYGWVESFIEDLDQHYDYRSLFKRINWESTEMLLRVLPDDLIKLRHVDNENNRAEQYEKPGGEAGDSL
ncbi:hypothetical protein [Nonomuraea sp. NPDC005692]|uniref:hypothetical protein n=1 Tax=Nonomuraea sp. NPDC005692 TaxID=3157168 RepID=UPI0033F5538C